MPVTYPLAQEHVHTKSALQADFEAGSDIHPHPRYLSTWLGCRVHDLGVPFQVSRDNGIAFLGPHTQPSEEKLHLTVHEVTSEGISILDDICKLVACHGIS